MNLYLKLAFSKHLPDVLSPTTLKQTIAEKAKALAAELDLPEVCLQPITDEELRISKYLSQTPAPQTPHISPLDTIYPTESLFKESSIQTTPIKKIYYIEEHTVNDYTAGQPIEDVCHSLRATNLLESNRLDNSKRSEKLEEKDLKNSKEEEEEKSVKPLTFVSAQLETETDITSFLLDFNKVKDPLKRQNSASNKSENDSSNGSSSEWEFLDN